MLQAALKDDKKAAKAGGEEKSSLHQPILFSWDLIHSAVGNGHDWASAFATLDRKIIQGDWKSDRASPTSQVGGCEARRRCCEVTQRGDLFCPLGEATLYQGTIKSVSVKAEGEQDPPPQVEAKATKEVRPSAHHWRSLLAAAHCPLLTAHRSHQPRRRPRRSRRQLTRKKARRCSWERATKWTHQRKKTRERSGSAPPNLLKALDLGIRWYSACKKPYSWPTLYTAPEESDPSESPN